MAALPCQYLGPQSNPLKTTTRRPPCCANPCPHLPEMPRHVQRMILRCWQLESNPSTIQYVVQKMVDQFPGFGFILNPQTRLLWAPAHDPTGPVSPAALAAKVEHCALVPEFDAAQFEDRDCIRAWTPRGEVQAQLSKPLSQRPYQGLVDDPARPDRGTTVLNPLKRPRASDWLWAMPVPVCSKPCSQSRSAAVKSMHPA